jgi:GT2 family glycosyltransferase
LHDRFPRIPYVQTGANLGYTGGNNAGIRWAVQNDADYVLVINNDAVVDCACVRTLVEAAQRRSEAAVVAPKILYFDAPDRIWFGGGAFSAMRALGVHRHQDDRDEPDAATAVEEITFFTGCCFLARASIVARTAGFDDTFFAYVEDAELSLRLRRAGHSLLYAPAARAYHRIAPGRQPPTPFHVRQRDKNRRRLVAKHYDSMQRLRFAAWFYPTRLAHALRYVLSGDVDFVRAQLDGAFGALDTNARSTRSTG